MSDEILADLAEHARFIETLTSIGPPRLQRAEPSRGAAPGEVAGEAGSPEQRLRAVRDDLGDCQRCKLAAGRKNIVFGQGNPAAALMFVGEGPGADEDEKGLAFVGRAGQLLTDIIEKGLKIPRADVFIANVIKCRPPQNRNPEPDEIAACQPFLEAQIDAIRPKVAGGARASSPASGCSRRPSPSRASAGAWGTTRESRSCPPTTRPFCCEIPPRRRTSGRT